MENTYPAAVRGSSPEAGHNTKAFVDPQHDVTCEDVRLAHREGLSRSSIMKRYTTLGMATDQGKMGNVIGLALMADALGKSTFPRCWDYTRFRPPYTPGRNWRAGRAVMWHAHFKPLRRTPLHDWNFAPWSDHDRGRALAPALVLCP